MSQQFLSIPAAVIDQTVAFVELTGVTTKRALDEVAVHRAGQTKAAALRPAVMAELVRLGVVPKEHEKVAEAMLGAHDTTLNLLKSAAEKIAELKADNDRLRGIKKAGDLGAGVEDPRPGGAAAGGSYQHAGEYNSMTHPIVGEKVAFVKESDRRLAAGAGVMLG